MVQVYPRLTALGPFVPYVAVVAAGTCNVAFTRMDEIQNGVAVIDAEGKERGRSVSAGKLAVFKTVTTRSAFLPIFPLLIPPLALSMTSLKPGALPHSMLSLVVITVSIATALPIALAIEPPQMAMEVSSLEPEFHDLKDSEGNPVTILYASKGL